MEIWYSDGKDKIVNKVTKESFITGDIDMMDALGIVDFYSKEYQIFCSGASQLISFGELMIKKGEVSLYNIGYDTTNSKKYLGIHRHIYTGAIGVVRNRDNIYRKTKGSIWTPNGQHNMVNYPYYVNQLKSSLDGIGTKWAYYKDESLYTVLDQPLKEEYEKRLFGLGVDVMNMRGFIKNGN